jgi:hypothetical protein
VVLVARAFVLAGRVVPNPVFQDGVGTLTRDRWL